MSLSTQEKLILECLITGATDKQIATRLNTTRDTIRGIMRHLLAKVGAKNRTQAALWAWHHPEVIHNRLANGHKHADTNSL